jgi:F420-non-reducing hydrogenase iron-sulfur subunit
MTLSSMSPSVAADYEPVVVAFVCTYCAYTAADLAGSLRLPYPANVRIVKMTCTGRTDPLVLLRTFEEGADAVFVAGCQPGDCHFQEGNVRGKAWVEYIEKRLEAIGLERERLSFFHVAASDAAGWVAAVTEMTERARRLGPSPFNPRFDKKRGAPSVQDDKESGS